LLSPEANIGISEFENCSCCGGINTVRRFEDFAYIDEDIKLNVKVLAYVCLECDDESFPLESFTKILKMKEELKGIHYSKITIEDGNIIRTTVH